MGRSRISCEKPVTTAPLSVSIVHKYLTAREIAWRALLVALLGLTIAEPPARAERLRLLHTNDMHAHHVPFRTSAGDSVGGFAHLASVVDSLRGGAGLSLLMDAGDIFQGTPFYNFFHGEAEVRVMSAIGYDVTTLGNHEFDDGPANALRQIQEHADYPVLCANVDVRAHVLTKATPPPPGGAESLPLKARQEQLAGLADTTWQPIALPYVILRAGERTVGVIGVVTETLPSIVSRKNIVNVRVRPVVPTVRALLPEVRRQADVVVVLSHCGLESDSLLAREVPGIDVIVAGHDHRAIPEPILVRVNGQVNGIGGTLLAETGQWGQNVGWLDLELDGGRIVSWRGGLVPVTPRRAAAPRVSRIIDEYREKVRPLAGQVLARTEVPLPSEALLREETALGNFVADCMRLRSGADIALQNGGGIRTELAAGPITVGDIFTLLPFDNTLVLFELTGKEVTTMLRESLIRRHRGGWGHVSGVTFVDSGGAPADIRIAGAPLDPATIYRVVTNSFTAGGGDGYTAFRRARSRTDTDLSIRDVVMEELKRRGTIAPRVEGRVTVRTPTPEAAPR